MTSPVATLSPDDSTQHAADTLTRRRISAAPVVDDTGAVLGMVSEDDLLAKAGRETGQTARDVMTTAVITVSTHSTIDDVRHLLIDRRVRGVPVMAQGRLVGIVSRHDVLAMLATEWVCRVCGEPVRGGRPPERCPRCHASSDRFELQEQPPGA